MNLRLIHELNLSPEERELLLLAGFEHMEDIEQWELSPFIEKIQRTNQRQKLVVPDLPSAKIQKWWMLIAASGESDLSDLEELAEPQHLVNFELDPEIQEMIRNAPVAEPLSAKTLAAKNVPVSAIPVAILMTSACGDVSVRVSTKSQEKSNVASLTTSSATNVNSLALSRKKPELDTSRFKSLHDKSDITPIPRDHFNLISTTRPETNAGVSPDSRRFVRGVLHVKPALIWWGAFFTLATQVVIPLGLVAIVLLLLKDQKPDKFVWVPSWLLVFPISVFVFGILYLTVSYNSSCRICGQKLFVPKNCLKNKKAHRIKFLGYIVPIALHTLIFRWFRCTHCGTAVRLKE